MRASEVLIMLLLVLCFIIACVYIPYSINEYKIPIYLRTTYSNVFLDYLKLRVFVFAYFIILSGTLPHFNFYVVDEDAKCLHTKN